MKPALHTTRCAPAQGRYASGSGRTTCTPCSIGALPGASPASHSKPPPTHSRMQASTTRHPPVHHAPGVPPARLPRLSALHHAPCARTGRTRPQVAGRAPTAPPASSATPGEPLLAKTVWLASTLLPLPMDLPVSTAPLAAPSLGPAPRDARPAPRASWLRRRAAPLA